VTPTGTDSVRLSDLLLGRTYLPPQASISHRDSLGLVPVYDLALAPNDSLVLYWETYGLRPDSTGVVRYRVSLEASEVDRGAIAQLAGHLMSVLGGGQRVGVSLSWDVEAPAGDGVQRNALAIDPIVWSAGTYRLRLRIEEAATGRGAVSERRITKAATQ
jgi:hypothetical protein